jgi:uncharacterized protein YfeS
MKSSYLLFVTFFFVLNLTGRGQTKEEKFEFSPATAHPNAKTLMKEDFFWSPIDESGPFGSDAGSDAAYGFQKWRKSHPATSPILYLKQLIDTWDFSPFAWDELDTAKIKLYISSPAHLDESSITQMVEILKKENERNASMPGGGGSKKLTDAQLRQIVLNTQKSMGTSYLDEIDQAIIGTAFAQFVMEGKADPALRNYAAKTIQREMLPIITRQFGQPDQVTAHNEKMNKLLQVVQKMPIQK